MVPVVWCQWCGGGVVPVVWCQWCGGGVVPVVWWWGCGASGVVGVWSVLLEGHTHNTLNAVHRSLLGRGNGLYRNDNRIEAVIGTNSRE